MSTPAVSVVMPVHNAAPYLGESIGSILGQTLEDLELVVLENGSGDESAAIARRYADVDARVRIFEHPRALGVVESSNRVISEATAPVIARMDADDVCRPERLERQLEVMRSDDDVVAVGTLVEGIDAKGRLVRPRDRWRLLRSVEMPFSHGSAMFRRRAFERAGGYREGTPLARDVELFLRIGRQGRIVVLPEALYRYRYHRDSTTLSSQLREVARSKHVLQRLLAVRREERDPDGVIESPANGPLPSDTVASALYYVGAMRLWAGERPAILGEAVRNESFRISRAWLRLLVWAAWADLHPETLRFFLRCVVRTRDAIAGIRLDDGRPYEWRSS